MDDGGIDNRHLKYLNAVVQTGSIRLAAELLDINPSSISRQIADLESDLSITLLDRHGRGCRPTQACTWLLDHYHQQLQANEEIRNKLNDLRGLKQGQVSIALGEGFVGDMMGAPFDNFHRRFPDIVFQVRTAGTTEIVRMVLDDEADIGLVLNPMREPKLTTHLVFAKPMHLAASTGHPIADANRPIDIRRIADYPLAVKFGSFGVRQILSKVERDLRIRFNIGMQTNSNLVIRRFVKSGHGLGLLTEKSLGEDNDGITLLPVDSEAFRKSMAHIITRRSRVLPTAVRYMLRNLVSHYK